MNTEPRYDLGELAELAGATVRTIRYYVQQGLLPAPGQMGPGSHWSQTHLQRLRLIRKLQRQHLPLSEIRRQLAELGDDAVARLLADEAKEETPGSAVDYVRAVLAKAGSPMRSPSSPLSGSSDRSQWERIRLDDDIELHVRRPLSREQNRLVERLLAEARRILAGA